MPHSGCTQVGSCFFCIFSILLLWLRQLSWMGCLCYLLSTLVLLDLWHKLCHHLVQLLSCVSVWFMLSIVWNHHHHLYSDSTTWFIDFWVRSSACWLSLRSWFTWCLWPYVVSPSSWRLAITCCPPLHRTLAAFLQEEASLLPGWPGHERMKH